MRAASQESTKNCSLPLQEAKQLKSPSTTWASLRQEQAAVAQLLQTHHLPKQRGHKGPRRRRSTLSRGRHTKTPMATQLLKERQQPLQCTPLSQIQQKSCTTSHGQDSMTVEGGKRPAHLVKATRMASAGTVHLLIRNIQSAMQNDSTCLAHRQGHYQKGRGKGI